MKFRRLKVLNPDNDLRFAVTLRGWAGGIFAIRAHPQRAPRGKPNPYSSAHRVMARDEIEAFLGRLEKD